MSAKRQCIGCREYFERDEMFRLLRDYKSDNIIFSPTNKDFGRSVYICKNKACIEKAFKKVKNSRFFKQSNIAELKNLLENQLIK